MKKCKRSQNHSGPATCSDNDIRFHGYFHNKIVKISILKQLVLKIEKKLFRAKNKVKPT